MFRKALIGFGVSLALLSGCAAGQESVSREPSEDSLARVEHAVAALTEEEKDRIKVITINKYEQNGAQSCGSAEIDWPATRKHWCLWELPSQSATQVQSLIGDAMSREQSDVMGETRQIVVIHKGRLVAESYREGFDPETKLVSWSMAKSITQALVGRAVYEGLIGDIDAPMPGPWQVGDPRAAITWRQWMTMTDGLEYREVGETDLARNDVVQMIYGRGRFDVIGYVEGLPQIHEAGTHWNYSTAAFHTISRALLDLVDTAHRANGPLPHEGQGRDRQSIMADWLKSALFTPLGMNAQPEFDAAGTFLGGSLVYASARDFARFGYLYLRDGVWDGKRLLPEGWVDFARTKAPAANANVYGAGWWITPPKGETPTHPQSARSAPYDAFHAGGNEGQTIWVVPSKDLVIVRLGQMSNASENWSALYEWNQKVARAFPDVK